MITDFGRHPNYRKKLDVEQLANSIRSWSGIKYSVSTCKSIHIPVQSNGDFILFILDQDTKTVNILDPTPVDPIYQYNPHTRYVHGTRIFSYGVKKSYMIFRFKTGNCLVIWLPSSCPHGKMKNCIYQFQRMDMNSENKFWGNY